MYKYMRYNFYEFVYYNIYFFFFFNDTATTEIYTLSLHDALPILKKMNSNLYTKMIKMDIKFINLMKIYCHRKIDRKSTRLNSSHANISYAVFCLKKKK